MVFPEVERGVLNIFLFFTSVIPHCFDLMSCIVCTITTDIITVDRGVRSRRCLERLCFFGSFSSGCSGLVASVSFLLVVHPAEDHIREEFVHLSIAVQRGSDVLRLDDLSAVLLGCVDGPVEDFGREVPGDS